MKIMNALLTKPQARAVRRAVSGQRSSIAIGRSCNSAGAGSGTPIVILPGDAAPRLTGQPYLKTQFRNGAFSKTLYTPSTLAIEVGADWVASNAVR